MVSRLIGRTTGDPTAPWGVRGTDLGYLSLTNHGYVLSTFGDTFSSPMPGEDWRSPVIFRTHNTDLENGIKWDNAVGGARAKEVISYRHNTDRHTNTADNPFTYIPNDVIHLPDGRYLMSAHAVNHWDRQGRSSWWTHANRFFTSTETHAEHWETARWADLGTPGTLPMQFNNDAGSWRVFQNASLVLWEDHLYMFGTESGRTDGGGIYLARVPWRKWDHLFSWEFWGWDGSAWRWGNESPTPILMPTIPGTPIGEINARVLDGQVVLAYMDYGIGAVTRTAVRPDSVWTDPQVHATALRFPRLYAPALHPYSTLERPYIQLSQWTDSFYGVSLLALDPLRSAGGPGDGGRLPGGYGREHVHGPHGPGRGGPGHRLVQ